VTQGSELGFRKGTKGPGGNIIRLVTAIACSVVLRGCVISDNFSGKRDLLVNKGVAPTIIGRVDDKRTISKETRADFFVKRNICLEVGLKLWVVNHGIVVHHPSFEDFALCPL
jgi:hypothetical protein